MKDVQKEEEKLSKPSGRSQKKKKKKLNKPSGRSQRRRRNNFSFMCTFF